MKKVVLFLLTFSCVLFLNFSVFAATGSVIIEPETGGYQVSNFTSSDNSIVYVAGKNLCPVSSITNADNLAGSIEFPLSICADTDLTISFDSTLYSDDTATNPRNYYRIKYSDGTQDSYNIYDSSVVKDGVSHRVVKSLHINSNKVVSSIVLRLFEFSSATYRHFRADNIMVEIGSTATAFSPYETIKEFSYPYTDLSLYDYSTIYSATGATLDFSINRGVYGDKRDFIVPVSLVTGWVTDFFNVVFSTWWSAVLVCLPLFYAVFCLILRIFDLRFESVNANFLRFFPYKTNVYKPHSYGYIRFRIFHPIRYIQISLEARGEKSVKKELLMQELNRRARANEMFEDDNLLNSVRIDGKIYYNPNKVIKTYEKVSRKKDNVDFAGFDLDAFEEQLNNDD